jgi:hypothetical protein
MRPGWRPVDDKRWEFRDTGLVVERQWNGDWDVLSYGLAIMGGVVGINRAMRLAERMAAK